MAVWDGKKLEVYAISREKSLIRQSGKIRRVNSHTNVTHTYTHAYTCTHMHTHAHTCRVLCHDGLNSCHV